jgi:hypothetical protein
VGQSLYGNWLRLADPTWLSKLKLGAVLKLWGLLVGFVMGAGVVFITVAGLPPLFIILLSVAAGVFGLAAVFLITAPEPTIGAAEDPINLRKTVRLCAVLGFLGGQLAQGLGSMLGMSVIVAGHILSLGGVVAMLGEFVYLRRFARRIPNPKLAKQTTVVMWGFGSATVASFAVGIVTAILGAMTFAALPAPPIAPGGTPATAAPSGAPAMTAPSGAPATTAPGGAPATTYNVTVVAPAPAGPPTTTTTVVTAPTTTPGMVGFAAIGIFGCFAGLAFLVFGVMYVALLIRYYGAFKQAVLEAERIARGELAAVPVSVPPPAST